MRYLEAESTYILSNFTTGDTVTITVYKLSDNSKIIDAAACSEISTTGRFKYSFSQSISTKTEYLWIAENGTEEQQGKIVLGGYPDEIATKLSSIETDTKGISDTAVSADGASPTVGSLADILRRLKWFVSNLWEIDENVTPNTFKIFKDDGSTTGLDFTVYTDSSKSYRDNTP